MQQLEICFSILSKNMTKKSLPNPMSQSKNQSMEMNLSSWISQPW